MKILIADQYSDLGGAQRVLLDLLPMLRRCGWEVVLAIPGRGALRTAAEKLGVRCESISCGPFRCGTKSVADLLRFGTQFARLRTQLRDLAADFQPDVLYVNGPRLVPAACSLGNYAPPIVFHLHSHLKQRYVAALTGSFLRSARATIVANCHSVLLPLSPKIGDLRVEVLYNGVRDYGFKLPVSRPCRIGVIGRICREKGQKEFVQAARQIHRSAPLARFIVCGGTQFSDDHAATYYRKLRELADGLPLEFTGWQEDVSAVLHSLDLLVVPSLREAEATTRVIPEAHSAGVPVLASDLPGIRELIQDGLTGFLCTPAAPSDIADCIRSILNASPEVLAAVTRNARRQFEQRFSMDTFERGMMHILEKGSVVSGRTPRCAPDDGGSVNHEELREGVRKSI